MAGVLPHENVSGEEQQKIPFPRKLFSILSVADYQPCISWSDGGSAFVVIDVNGFSDNVMPKYFGHGNYQASFLLNRQWLDSNCSRNRLY
mmetsp:Transcript_64340/g.126328  ORF Transcript_64340/g.126328 Transcript_64340/m.126328 type:complete len:90 (-) Transcript_64340:716-985(-)